MLLKNHAKKTAGTNLSSSRYSIWPCRHKHKHTHRDTPKRACVSFGEKLRHNTKQNQATLGFQPLIPNLMVHPVQIYT